MVERVWEERGLGLPHVCVLPVIPAFIANVSKTRVVHECSHPRPEGLIRRARDPHRPWDQALLNNKNLQ